MNKPNTVKHRGRRKSLPWRTKVLWVSVPAVAVMVTVGAVSVVVPSDVPSVSSAPGSVATDREAREATAALLDVAPESVVDRAELDTAIDDFRSVLGAAVNVEGMTLDQLQRQSAKVQAQFVEASILYDQIAAGADQAREAAAVAESTAQAAEEEVAVTKDRFVGHLSTVYTSGLSVPPSVTVMSTDADDQDDVVSSILTSQKYLDDTAHSVQRLDEARVKAERSHAAAKVAKYEVEAYESRVAELVETIEGRSSDLAEQAAMVMAERGSYPVFSQAEQDARNRAAKVQWESSRRKMQAALTLSGLKWPTLRQVRDAGRLPDGFLEIVDSRGKPVHGVAGVRTSKGVVVVLPRSTVKSVDRAFKAVGAPYLSGTLGPDTYDCVGFARASVPSLARGKHPVALLKGSRVVPSRSAQVGDVVFFSYGDDGVQHVGLNLGGGLMMAADAASSQVGVVPFPDGRVFAVRGDVRGAKPLKGGSVTSVRSSAQRCGAFVPAGAASMTWPVSQDHFTFSAEFGASGSMWARRHTGQDFSAPSGTPVMAAADGVVRVEGTSWGGPHHVWIEHGDGLESGYAHMSSATVKTGDRVRAGEVVGAVGSLGNSTGPHLHFEVIVDGVKVDPMFFLPGGRSGGWGGFSNGMIPSTSMCPIGVGSHMLRCDAAMSFRAMAKAYTKKFKEPLCVTDSYRSFAGQVDLYARKPGLAATPGTSNHGWAMALDMCGGIESFKTVQHAWMKDNANRFGWVHPSWARQGGGREEPWHWEFNGA